MVPINMPISPAYVHNYRTKKPIKITPMVDYCSHRDIPFSSEEEIFYKLKQQKDRFRLFRNTITDLYESGRPDEVNVGFALLFSN